MLQKKRKKKESTKKTEKFHLKWIITGIIMISLCSSCSSTVRYAANSKSSGSNKNQSTQSYYPGQILTGKSSFYGSKFHGRQTANGEIFDMYKLSAAHRDLPFETLIKVTNTGNNKSVVVHVNDRGPFVAGRILDLSYGAAQKIDMVDEGVATVTIEIIRVGK